MWGIVLKVIKNKVNEAFEKKTFTQMTVKNINKYLHTIMAARANTFFQDMLKRAADIVLKCLEL